MMLVCKRVNHLKQVLQFQRQQTGGFTNLFSDRFYPILNEIPDVGFLFVSECLGITSDTDKAQSPPSQENFILDLAVGQFLSDLSTFAYSNLSLRPLCIDETLIVIAESVEIEVKHFGIGTQPIELIPSF